MKMRKRRKRKPHKGHKTIITVCFYGGILIFFAALFFSEGCNCNRCEDRINPNIDSTFCHISSKGMTLWWKVENDSLHIAFKAPGKGWVAVGINPSRDDVMTDANFIVGYVKDGATYIQDEYGININLRVPDTSIDGTEDFRLIGGWEYCDKTEIEFIIPMKSTDIRDRILNAGVSYVVILSYGPEWQDYFGLTFVKMVFETIQL